MAQLLYSSSIVKVRFSLSGSDAARNDSWIKIRYPDLFKNNKPYPEGVCDGHLGTTDHMNKCYTCVNGKRNCIGHEGSIEMNYPVWNPIAVSEGRKWLRLICHKCGKPVINESEYIRYPKNKRLDEAQKIAKSKTGRKCPNCGAIHPTIRKNKQEHLLIDVEYYDETKKKMMPESIDEEHLYPHQVGDIFQRISDETVVRLGKSVNSHPRNFILDEIKVPSVVIRPDIKKIGGGKSTNDPLTAALQFIIKKNDAMGAKIPARVDKKYAKAIFELNNSYYEFVRAKSIGNSNSLALRLKGKQGRFRRNQMGKRARNMCRGTITGDPTLKIDEVGVPILFARTVQYKEVVQEYNKKQLLIYVQNGRKKYPGATKVIKRNGGGEYDVDSAREIELENGDVVLRDMIDGDPVNFGRQPSLMISNISCMRAKITHDPNLRTLRMNVIACKWYGADFDGDAMLLSINASIGTRNEIAELASASNWLISHTKSSPFVGQVDDSIIGTAELTRNGVKFNKYHAMLLFGNNTNLPSFAEVGADGLTGYDIITKLLEPTPISFERVPDWYRSSLAQWVRYDPKDIKVKIDQGKMLQGVLDKKSIGAGARGGIYHLIANEYGNRRALTVMHDMQQAAIEFMKMRGYTIGIMDLRLSPAARSKIDKIAADIINKSLLITEQLNNGEIIPPIDKTVEQFFEEKQLNTLSIYDDFTEPILEDIRPNINNLFKMIATGSKGAMDNLFNMLSAIGQKQVNGERARQKFGYKRTLAYFHRFDTTPEARGYIANSYLNGMTSSEYIFDAMDARFSLISKALSTSVTGEQNRKSIKNLESTVTNNMRAAVKDRNIVQIIYGEDGLDPTKVIPVKFPSVMMSDEAFQKKYLRKGFEKEYEQILKDRELYRKQFLKIEGMNIKELFSDERRVPVDVEGILNEFTREYGGDILIKSPDLGTLRLMADKVTALCDNLPYLLINEIQERKKMPIPAHLYACTWLMEMLVRMHLHPNELYARNMTPAVLEHIINKIRMIYTKALVEPGTAVGIIAAMSFSEPLTQYMLDAHRRAASGGTSKSSMRQAREVLGAKAVSKLENPTMLIPVESSISDNHAKVQEIANNIEVMKMKQFVVLWQVFFEKFGRPVHTKYAHEHSMIADFVAKNPLLEPPADLVNWCIRIVLNKTTLILKNMSLELIITKLRETFPAIYIVYTNENAPQVILRVYAKNTEFSGNITLGSLITLKDQLLNTIIRGVDGITSTKVVPMLRMKIRPDGSIVRNDNIFGIATNGTNLSGVLALNQVDRYNVQTDAIQETFEIFGIEAARQKIVTRLRDLVDVCNHRHYLTYADEMTYTGKVTSIESGGLKTRESSNVLLRVGFVSPLVTLEEAAANSMEDTVTGVTAPLLVGGIPHHGTLYNSFHVNIDFVREHVKNPDIVLEEGIYG